MDYIEISFGLSLNDSYWITPNDGKEYLWEKQNLYNNKFSEFLSLVAFTGYGENISALNISPEYTTNGMLKKCWKQKNSSIYLIKGSGKLIKPFPIFDNGLCMLNIITKIEINDIEYLKKI